MRDKYIDCETFQQFKENQTRLIDILNHSVSRMRTDIGWIKGILFALLGVGIAQLFT